MNATLAAHAVPGWLLAAHLLGVVAWAGGLLVLTRALWAVVALQPDAREAAAGALRRGYLTVVFPGSLLAILTGLYLLIGDPGEQTYMKQGWMHVKLTLLLLLMAAEHVMVMRPLKALSRGTMSGEPARRAPLFRFAHLAVVLLTAGILAAVLVMR